MVKNKSSEVAIFKTVRKHLLKQNCKSIKNVHSGFGGVECRYRGKNGTRCAIGCLISDKFYNKEMEGLGAQNDIIVKAVARSLNTKYLKQNTVKLLGALQSIHDDCDVDEWKKKLKEVATLYRLKL